MRQSCSMTGIMNPLHSKQGVGDVQTAGFSGVMLDMELYYPGSELEKADSNGHCVPKGDIRNFMEQLTENGLSLTAVRTPQLCLDTKRTDLNEYLLKLARETIGICEEYRVKYVIVPPLFAGVTAASEWEINHSFYQKLAACCTREETCLLLENQCKDISGHLVRGICADADIAVRWLEELNRELGMERFGFCLNVGTCNLCGQNMQEVIGVLDKYLKVVVLRDNDGHENRALLPFTAGSSVTDWLSLIRGLRQIQFDGELVLDMGDTARAFSPLLRPNLLMLAKSVTDFFVWQITIEAAIAGYKSIVLFGAGNMCRNFMKCYGEKYPPLFTCDNSERLWGSNFCGLTVRSPEALRDIPADCGVVICNIYYREIEQQLRDMGITNIVYFNDEYMPSFYFEQLEYK